MVVQALQMRRAVEKYKRCLFGRYIVIFFFLAGAANAARHREVQKMPLRAVQDLRTGAQSKGGTQEIPHEP